MVFNENDTNVGADLLPTTGLKMNFLLKWSAGGISKFIKENILITKNKDFVINFEIPQAEHLIKKFILNPVSSGQQISSYKDFRP